MKNKLLTVLVFTLFAGQSFGQSTDKDTTNTHGERIDSSTERTAFKTALQLENVNNTSDVNKPISTLTQAGLDLKLTKSLNLSDLANAATARTNLGLGTLATQSGTFSGTSSGTNTGDNAINTLYSGIVSNATHTGDATGSTALTVVKINGTQLSTLATGLLKNTTTTGVPSIAVAGTDYLTPTGSAAGLTAFPTLNQNTTGSAATLTTARTINGTSFNGSANITVTAAAGTLTGSSLAATVTGSSLTSVGTLVSGSIPNTLITGLGTLATQSGTFSGTSSGTNTGDNAINTLYSGIVSNATHTGDATGSTALTVVKVQGKSIATPLAGDNGKFVKYDSGTNSFVYATVGGGGGDLLASNNLSELANVATARTNLGLGTLATQSGTFSGTSSGTNTGNQTTMSGITDTLTNFNNALTGADFATLAGAEALTNKTLTNPTVNDFIEGVVAIGSTGATQTIALTNGTVQTATLTANCTFTMPTATAGKSFVVYLKTGTGSFTGTFTGVKWSGGTAPVITTTASRMDIISFLADGTNWYGSYTQDFTP